MAWMRRTAAVLGTVLLAACGREQSPAPDEAAVAGPAEEMEEMEGMGGMQMERGMMERMRAHMQRMQGASGEQVRAELPQHRQMVANMISQMNREMREMAMPMDEEWSSTIDAVRQDLTRLPEMTPQELETFMPEHRDRVARLMEMHRRMMADMKM